MRMKPGLNARGICTSNNASAELWWLLGSAQPVPT